MKTQRPLNVNERLLWSIDQNVPLSFVMIAHLTGRLNKTVLKQALNIVRGREPALKCEIKFKKDKPVYDRNWLSDIPLKIETRKDSDRWLTIAEEEMQEPLKQKRKPLVRVRHLVSPGNDESDLLITFSHVIADATSGVIFVKKLLSTANALRKYQGENFLTKPLLFMHKLLNFLEHPVHTFSSVMLKRRLPAPVDLLKDKTGSPMTKADSDPDNREPVTLPLDREVPATERKNRVIHKMLTKKEAKKILSRCRKEKTTVHGTICAALLQALVMDIKENNRKNNGEVKNGPLKIGCLTPVNIRRHLSMDVGDNMGNFISNAVHFQLIDDKVPLWEAAGNVKKALQEELDSGNDIKGLINWGKNTSPENVLKDIDKLNIPAAVTNLGFLDIDEQFGSLTLNNLHFTVSMNPTVPIGIAVTSFHGPITLNFIYLEPCLKKERAENIVENTMKRLLNVLQ